MSQVVERVDVESLRQEIREIAREKLVGLDSRERPARVNRPQIRALGESGILPRIYSDELGGTAGTNANYATTLCALREALSMESTEASMALAVQAGASSPMIQAGSAELKAKWIPKVARGEAVPAFALTEPGFGSDAGHLSLLAEKCEGGWRLTGEKSWITNAPDADIFTIFARTTPGAGSKGVTAFVIPAGTEGLSGEPVDLMKAHATGSLFLNNVFVGPDQVLGEVDGGFRSAMRTLDAARAAVGAAALGAGQAALEAAIAHAKARHVFGRRLADYQATSHTLAEMATQLAAARLLIYEAARAFDEGREDVGMLASMGKLAACEAGQFAVDAAIQIHGASGLETSHMLVRLYHEVRSCRFEDGTTEITKEVIARTLLRD